MMDPRGTGLTGLLPIVGVIGSGSEPHTERAELVGRWLAGRNVHLLTGGGGGVMESVSRAFFKAANRKGLAIGIVPGACTDTGYAPKEGYPNPFIEIPIFTHLPLSGGRGTDPMSRNHINILSSNVIIALPGSAGTASEVTLALRYGRPIVAYLDRRGEIPGIPEEVRVEKDFERVKRFITSKIYNDTT